MDEFITDEDLAFAVGLELREFQKLVDWLRLRKNSVTGCVKVSSQHQRKVLWAWDANVVESVATDIMGSLSAYRLMRSCGHS